MERGILRIESLGWGRGGVSFFGKRGQGIDFMSLVEVKLMNRFLALMRSEMQLRVRYPPQSDGGLLFPE